MTIVYTMVLVIALFALYKICMLYSLLNKMFNYYNRVRSGIMSIVLFPANILLHTHPISSTFKSAWCGRLHTLSGNCLGFYVHFSKIVQHGDNKVI